MDLSIAIIGGGNLGTAIAEGLIGSGFISPGQLWVTRRNPAMLHHLATMGIHTGSGNREAVHQAKIIILAVKPFQLKEVLAEFAGDLRPEQLLVSVVTGISLAEIQELCRPQQPIFRAMPNTAISIRESMTCLACLNAEAEQTKLVEELFLGLGKLVHINEQLMDAATVLGACGTAYAMRFIRANIQGGIEIGFDAATARLIAAQTVKGAADLLLRHGAHPEEEIDKVTTPKGCTIAGLNEMEHRGFSSSLIRGIIASFKKINRD